MEKHVEKLDCGSSFAPRFTQGLRLWTHLCAGCIRQPELFTFDGRAENCAEDSVFYLLLNVSLLAILPPSFGRISVAHGRKSQLASGAYCTVATQTDGRLQAH